MAAPTVPTGATKTKRRRLPRDLPRFLLLCVEAIIFLAPFYWMISTSLKSEPDTIASPVQWIPLKPTLENYIEVLNAPDANILRWAWNSFFTSSVFAIGHVILCAITAYPLARLRFKGRDAWFWFILTSLMVPGIVTLIPTYVMMIQLNWIDTYHAMIWPGIAGVFGVFLLRQFFSGIPRELEEAARLDGANSLQILRHVILPLSIPALVTLGIFSFLGCWNQYVWPLFVAHGDMQTLPVGIGNFNTRYGIEYGKLMAGAAIAAVPVLIAYLLAQRYIVQGLTLTGMKD
ncbi:carbohydrate ABC transporter permease [Deinococcus peraridilitoris]|uniref:ABC-type sugar transport system, permease component n=1 Tax=Deinococcus peraridilitoris (strain DSM 19664 / LMG 22246 / CIP 109416 / KR-200) TaxID=937777 RepID=L0A003_DEIPD|nr:carbohydrate ABC transporter permease [Deinococcus peraridilitoris]AFZ66350.1 ABC-type sugar transport system, permease component [Deinococcus peraridilitoris DSM 19664]